MDVARHDRVESRMLLADERGATRIAVIVREDRVDRRVGRGTIGGCHVVVNDRLEVVETRLSTNVPV